MLLISKENNANFQAIHEVLSTFSVVSWVQINNQKSKVWFSQKVSQQTINLFYRTFNVNQTNDLGMYLGFPLKPIYMKNDFSFVLDKLKSYKAGKVASS